MHRSDASLCDYNRAGTPLMEIVTEPDLHSPYEASAFAEELRRILIGANTSEADMYKGMMRFDASISLRPKGDKKLYPRIEIKNLNSFKALEKALAYQERVLRKLWAEGRQPTGETTVGWIDEDEKTVLLRDKESAADYRYFPEPDIPPLVLDPKMIAAATLGMHKLPSEAKQEYVGLGLTNAEATMLVDQPAMQAMFDAVNAAINDAKRASSLVLTQLLGYLKERNLMISEGPSTAAMVELATIIKRGDISVNTAKEVLEKMVDTKKSAPEIIKAEGLQQVSDTGALEKIVKEAIAANADAVESYRKGKTSALGAVVGWIMKQTKGQANPGMVNELIKKHLQ